MNKRELFEVALKYLALILIFSFISTFLQLVFDLVILSKTSRFFVFEIFSFTFLRRAVLIVVYAITIFLFLKKTNTFAVKFIPEETSLVSSQEDVLIIVIAFQGVSLIIEAVIHIVTAFIYYLPHLPYLQVSGASPRPNQYLIELVVYTTTLILGIWLLIYTPKISRFLWSKILVKFWKK